MVVFQAVQIAVALPIVLAFGALQLRFVGPDDPRYLTANLVSAAGLAVIAVITFQLGFVITNGLWAAVSAVGLARHLRRRATDDRLSGG